MSLPGLSAITLAGRGWWLKADRSRKRRRTLTRPRVSSSVVENRASGACRDASAEFSCRSVKVTTYFRFTRTRPDRVDINQRWIEAAIATPIAQVVQSDGRIRRWVYVPERARYLGVVLLADGETVHNAFFD